MNRPNIEAINDVVCGYIGNIYSAGSCEFDEKALRNLIITMELIDNQMNGIIDEYKSTKRCSEGSRIKSHEECRNFLLATMNSIRMVLEDE